MHAACTAALCTTLVTTIDVRVSCAQPSKKRKMSALESIVEKAKKKSADALPATEPIAERFDWWVTPGTPVTRTVARRAMVATDSSAHRTCVSG